MLSLEDFLNHLLKPNLLTLRIVFRVKGETFLKG